MVVWHLYKISNVTCENCSYCLATYLWCYELPGHHDQSELKTEHAFKVLAINNTKFFSSSSSGYGSTQSVLPCIENI